MTARIETDFLVLGSGIAGLTFARHAAAHGRVVVLSKATPEEGSTLWAQGGVAAVMDEEDSFDLHVGDTLAAGVGLCHEEAVRVMVEGGPEAIRDLRSLGVPFSMADDALDLGREGAHSRRRIVHAADLTGRAIETTLLEEVRGLEEVSLHPRKMALDLLTLSHHGSDGSDGDRCLGAYVLDRDTGEILTYRARCTVLATGGAGKVYLYTTNPDVSTGDGVAMAYRAGCSVANLEFFQFHPTCLYHPHAKSFLISEAVRGEGGVLVGADGRPFMGRYDERAELAPRDIVARAIDQEMKETGEDCVFLDISHKEPGFLRDRFPGIHERCLALGIDITREPIPVVPAAHYLCGGVRTDLEGRTDLAGLWAVGETAHTGAHGANRLASNSLLEGLVFGRRAARAAARQLGAEKAGHPVEVPDWDASGAIPSDETVVVSHSWDEIRRFMWNYVGIFRSDTRLARARRRIEMIQQEIKDYYWKFIVTSDLLELRNLALVAELIITSALSRKESRGLHYNTTWPETLETEIRDTVLRNEERSRT